MPSLIRMSNNINLGDTTMYKRSLIRTNLSFGLLTIALGLGSTAFAHDDYSQNQNSYYSQNSSRDDDEHGSSQKSDPELTKEIRDKISSGWFTKGFDQVNVRVNDGSVTLDGQVKTYADKEKVEKEVRNIDGVKNLNSQITVSDANSKPEQKQFPQDTYLVSADNQLNKKIRDNVSKGWLWNSYKEVRLNTSNGVVTLEGTVDSLKDQDKLINEIQKVEGVKAVKSALTVKNR
jgi:osmotically-inducible protein OsmY